MYDSISVFQHCPKCNNSQVFDAQTKDLDCSMYRYETLHDDWWTDELGRARAIQLPIYPKFPLDKSTKLWKNQAVWMEARATIPKEYYNKLQFVEVLAECPSCHVWVTGKIKIIDNKLIGSIYDITTE